VYLPFKIVYPDVYWDFSGFVEESPDIYQSTEIYSNISEKSGEFIYLEPLEASKMEVELYLFR